MSDTLQQIKDRLNTADFIRTYVQLSPAGKNLKGLCPFHKEKTPSFIVSPDRQIWHCFGCNAGGDIISFLMRYENLEFFEALKILGEKAGIDVGKTGTQDQKRINILYEINRAAKDFFKEALRQAQGNQATDYLIKRGLKPETVEEFEIGFAPDSPDAITRALLGARYSIADIEKAGLSIKTERGTYRDRFRNRIMFPLFNQFGKVIGFTGRIMPLPSVALAKEGGFELPKYVNSPETPIFNKSKLLYGLDKSKKNIRETNEVLLVEGQMDFLMTWQDGIKNVVATSGTALTEQHLKTLEKIANTLLLRFDNDSAGQLAIEKSIDLAKQNNFDVKIIRPQDLLNSNIKDPADLAKEHPGFLKKEIDKELSSREHIAHDTDETSAIFSKVIREQSAMSFYFDRYPVDLANQDIKEKKNNTRIILSKIKLHSPIERNYWLRELETKSGIAEKYLLEEIENLKTEALRTETVEIVQNQNHAPLSRKEMISQRIASLVLNNRDFYNEIVPQLNHLPLNYQSVVAYHFDNKSLSLSPELQALADLINLRAGLEIPPSGGDSDLIKVKTELAELFRQIRLENYKERRQVILTEIRLAEQKNDETVLSKALTEFDRLSKEMQNLESNR